MRVLQSCAKRNLQLSEACAWAWAWAAAGDGGGEGEKKEQKATPCETALFNSVLAYGKAALCFRT